MSATRQPQETGRLSTSSQPPAAARLALATTTERLTHYLFRYPAKFHPPVARSLLDEFTKPSNLVLDPFCGSGTLLVEALVSGRRCIGIDIDPVAAAVSAAKTHSVNPGHLKSSAERLTTNLRRLERPETEYNLRNMPGTDISPRAYADAASALRQWIPAIPNLGHWFRRYVVIDLARIRRAIETVDIPETHRRLFAVVLASTIRNASNADPVPVSGLEVTAYMLRREAAGRVVNPYALFRTAMKKAVAAHRAFASAVVRGTSIRITQGNATDIGQHVRANVDAVITSPPYHGAVDYYRRHQLEMYWLGATNSHAERLDLLPKYIGRPKVPASHPFVQDGVLATALAKEWESRIRDVDPARADAFRHYLVAMTKFFAGLASRLDKGKPVVLVLGHSNWNKSEIPTTELFTEIAHSNYWLDKTYYYPVQNRYMSYSRHNGANIDTEHVLVLRRR